MKSQAFAAPLFLILFVLVTVALANGGGGERQIRGPILGGYSPIKNVKDSHVQEIGKFAVTEYNSQSKAGLKFVRVLSGETQVVAGINYRLLINTKKGRTVQNYQAVVWEKPWENFIKLTSFNPVAC